MALAGIQCRSTQSDALVQSDIITYLSRHANNDTHAVLDEKTSTELRAGMDFNSGKPARELRKCPRQEEPVMLPQPMMDAVPPKRMQAGVKQYDLQFGTRRGIAFKYRGDVFAHEAEIRTHSYTETGSVA